MIEILLESWLKIFSKPYELTKFAQTLVARDRTMGQRLAKELAEALNEPLN